jgi:uncharacterized phosphatase
MKTEVWLIRHGETEWNRLGKIQGHEDIDLNAEGIRQAKMAGEVLRDVYFTVILSSPLKRAFKTAEYIQAANHSAPPLVEDQNLIERHYGSVSGMTYLEKETFMKTNGDHGMETEGDLNERALQVLNHIVDTFHGERLAVVSHGGFIKTLLVAASKGQLQRDELFLRNCSISKLIFENGAWKVLEYNLTDYGGN